jgi:hypothetical protein
MNNNDKKWWVAKTLRMASFLKNKGFTVVNTVPDKNNPKYNVFIFNAQQQGFQEALREYSDIVNQ